jgi:hypothetical protein
MQRPDQAFDHRRLEPVAKPRPGRRKQPNPEVRSEAGRNPNEDLEARADLTSLNPREVALVDACSGGQRTLADPRLGPKLRNLGPDPDAQLSVPALQLSGADRD